MGHGEKIWQNVVHWKREWQTTSVFLPWEPHEQYEKAKRFDTERWTPQVGRWPICYWRNNSRKNEGTEPKQKQYPVVDVMDDVSKIWCHKQQYCIGTWNVRSTKQGNLEVVKQEMARVNINILGISKLKWTGMGEFNSNDHYIYYCRQEAHRRKEVAIIVNKRVQNAVLGCSPKKDRMISVHFQGKPFSSTVTQVYVPTSNAAEAEVEWF